MDIKQVGSNSLIRYFSEKIPFTPDMKQRMTLLSVINWVNTVSVGSMK
jgi:hypothetical protein